MNKPETNEQTYEIYRGEDSLIINTKANSEMDAVSTANDFGLVNVGDAGSVISTKDFRQAGSREI